MYSLYFYQIEPLQSLLAPGTYKKKKQNKNKQQTKTTTKSSKKTSLTKYKNNAVMNKTIFIRKSDRHVMFVANNRSFPLVPVISQAMRFLAI